MRRGYDKMTISTHRSIFYAQIFYLYQLIIDHLHIKLLIMNSLDCLESQSIL